MLIVDMATYINSRSKDDSRTPEERFDIIEAKGNEVAEALVALRANALRGTKA